MQCDPEARLHLEGEVLDRERVGQRLLNPLGEHGCLCPVNVYEQEAELVAAEPCNRVAGADPILQAASTSWSRASPH